MALANFLQLLRPQSVEERRALQRYRAEVQQMGCRLRTILDDWLELREIESDYAQLANASAVSRWELMRLVKDAERLEPPRSITNLHREVHNELVGAARACQLLANGYRFHKADAICDGQALLVETVENLNGLAAQLQMREMRA